jgi:hypothetical protein
METKGLLFGSIGLERARHVFLKVGIIDLLMSSAVWRGWSILRREASNNAPLSKRDSGEVARDEYSPDHERPFTRFMVIIASLGIVDIIAG